MAFPLCWNVSFRGQRQQTVSMVFSRALTEKVPSSLNEGRMTTAFLIISLRWRITLLKQRGLCELCEIAETLSIVYVKFFKLFLYLIVWKAGAVDELPRSINSKKRKIMTQTREKVSSEWRLFSKMNFVTRSSADDSSCCRIESTTLTTTTTTIYYGYGFPFTYMAELARTQTSCERVLRKLMWLQSFVTYSV